MNDIRAVARPPRLRTLAITGLLATLAAMTTTTVAAALFGAAGVNFQIPNGGETIPLPGIAVLTGIFALVGVAIAIALLRWSSNPAHRFLWTTGSLTAISLIPPLLANATPATTTSLLALHLLAAAVMIPTLTRTLHPS
ncbi:DUF6069 family protein [Kribbella sp. NPDC055071]